MSSLGRAGNRLAVLWATILALCLPESVRAETNASVAAGENHSLLLRTDGSLWSMGKNDRGQLGNGSELERGLVGWWKFDGDATDSSGNGNDGTVNGATLTTDRHGQANRAYSFDGVDDYIKVDNDFGGTVTISLWAKSSNIQVDLMAWCFGNQNSGPNLFFNNGKLSLNTWDSDNNSFAAFVPVLDKWHKYVTIISSQTTAQYVDGVLLGSAGYRSPSGNNFYISMDETSYGNYAWIGSIDDVRIYNRALSASEVSALYTLESQPFSLQPARVVDENVTAIASGSETSYFIKKDGSLWGMGRNDRGQLGNARGLDQGLVGWWKFDGDATDSSGNGNDGTVNGATLTTDRHGQANGAYSFDGEQDHVIVPHSSTLDFQANNSFSVSSWISPDSLSSITSLIINKQIGAGASQDGWNINLNPSNALGLRVQDGSGTISATIADASISANDYYHFIFTFDGGTGTLFLNGQLLRSETTLNAIVGDNASSLVIGKPTWSASNAAGFNGSIDDVRIYDRALSDSEVSALYTLESEPEDPSSPIQIVEGNVTAVSSRGSHALFQKTDGTLWAMGSNAYGQLGDGTTTDRHTPMQVFAWEEKASNSLARIAYDGVEVIDGKLYFAGGKDGSARSMLECYDPATNQWETLAPMSTARWAQSAAVLNGKLYVIGGQDQSDVEIYDPTASAWSTGTALPSEVNHGAAITVNGKILLFGGRNASDQVINQVLEFDPGTNVWSVKTSMPTARSGMKLVLIDGKVWAIAGATGVSKLAVCEIYDPAADAWTIGPSLMIPRNHASAWVANDRIYVGGGRSAVTTYPTLIESYDPSSNSWRFVGRLPSNSYSGDVGVSGNKVYLVVGSTASGVYSNKLYMTDLNPVTAFSAGGDHSRFVQADGSLWAMGRNHVGQIGDGTTTDRPGPVKVVDSGVADVESGLSHGYYLTTGGDLWSMGSNADGQLGDGTTTDRSSPVQVLNGSNVNQVSAGSKEGFFTKTDGTTWSMGRNDEEQLGNGSTTDISTPARLFTWKQNQSISQPRKVYSGAESLDGKIYLSGGFDGNASSSFERYDPVVDQWESLPALPDGLIGSMTGILDGKIYSIGGATQVSNQGVGNLSGESFYLYAIDGISDELLVIDPDDGNFSIVGDLGVDFNSLSTMDYNPVDGKLYANAGRDLYSIDLSNGVASEVSTMPRASGNPSPSITFHDDGRLFIHYEITGPTKGTGYFYNDVNFNGEVTVGSPSSFFRNIFATELDGTGKIWSANQETAKLGRSNGTNYSSEWVGADSILTHPLDLDITSDNKIFLMTATSWPSEVSDSTISRFSELNNVTGGVSTSYHFTRGQLGSVASAPLSVVSKRQQPQSNVRFFDPVANNWNDGPSLPSAIHRGSIVSLSDRILILGGLNVENNRTGDVYELLSGSSSWTTKASMPTSRSVTASAVLDGKVWVVGGIDFSWSDKVEIFDPSTNSWTSGPSLNSPRVSPVAWVSSGTLHVAGGFDGTTYLNSIETYDPSSNSWLIAGTLPESIFQSDAVVVDEEVFLVGGENNASRFPSGMTTLNSSPLTFASGNSHSIMVKQDGTFWGIGRNDSGQIGDGSLTNRSYPVPIFNSYTLVVNGAAEGNATGGGEWPIGTPVTLTATPNPGYLFAGWTGDLNSTDANVTLSPSGDLEVNATFVKDLNDTDGDGLTNYRELAILGTKADDNDTDDDGLLDGNETAVGLDPKVAHTALMKFFAQREVDARKAGVSEGNSTGKAYLQANRAAYSLYSESEKNASADLAYDAGMDNGNSSGIDYVKVNPSLYRLFTAETKQGLENDAGLSGFADGNASGLDYVRDNLASYGLYTEANKTLAVAAARTSALEDGRLIGEQFAKENPAKYDLFTLAEKQSEEDVARSDGFTSGRASGVQYVKDHPRAFSLFTESEKNASVASARTVALAEGFDLGIEAVQTNPGSFNLFTESEKNASEASARTVALAEGLDLGIEAVQTDPETYDLFSIAGKVAAETSARTAALAEGRELGVAAVRANPGSFDLVTEAEKNATVLAKRAESFAEGNATGVSQAKANPELYGLFTETRKNLRIEQARESGVTLGNKQGRATGMATAQAEMALEGMALLTYVDAVRAKPHTQGWHYQPGAGWLWTSPQVFPHLYLATYSDGTGRWLYFDLEREEPDHSRYYDFGNKLWKEIEP